MTRPSSFKALCTALAAGLQFVAAAGPSEDTATKLAVVANGGDYEQGLIANVVLAKPGIARGWGWGLEASELANMAKLCAQMPNGLKCRADHPGFGRSAVGTSMAAVKNIREEDGKLLGDIHFLTAADAKTKQHIFDLVAERPDFIAMSLVGNAKVMYYYDEKGKRQDVTSYASYKAYREMPDDTVLYVQFSKITAYDFVDEGALTDGLAASANTTPTEIRMSKRLKFDINAETTEGVAIKIKTNNPEPTEGDEVVVVDEAGAETGPAPDGSHTLAGEWDGYTIEVAESKITKVTKPDAEEEAPAETPEASEGTQTSAAAGQATELLASVKQLQDANTKLQAGYDKLAEEVAKLTAAVKAIPAGAQAFAAGADQNAGNGGGQQEQVSAEITAAEKIAEARTKRKAAQK